MGPRITSRRTPTIPSGLSRSSSPPPQKSPHCAILARSVIAPAITATTVLIRMSRLRTWANSWARTPYSSSGFRIRISPSFTQMAEWSGFRPVAKALGDGSGLT